MARNASVVKFRNLLTSLQNECLFIAGDELNRQADDLVSLMISIAPQGPTGNLKKSIRKEKGLKLNSVVIKAGGPTTTREVRKQSGVFFDYSRAVEFGSHGRPGTGFFFGTYRLRKKKIRSAVKRKLTAAIKKRSAQ